MQTATMGAIPISLTVTDLRHRVRDSIITLFTLFCNFSFDSLFSKKILISDSFSSILEQAGIRKHNFFLFYFS